MTIRLYDTLTRAKRDFVPLVPGQVGMYVCGPTVYDDCHIGHLMGPVLFDAVARWFTARGYAVRFVNNITDIDDKIINRAAADGVEWPVITRRYTAQYRDWLDQLHVRTITDHPKCSDYIAQMVEFVGELIAHGRAYVGPDGVAYDVLRQPNYGKLSGRKLDDMIAGARIERDAALHHPADFALWKLAKPGEPSWPSPWGAGRPGWHIECSVMSREVLGSSFDIHGGGDDLKFPHHENEIAQSEAHGDRFACCWMHNGLIQFDGVKVGKSDPRMKDPAFRIQFQAAHLINTFGAATVRFLLLQGHYRRPIDFAPSHLTAARTALGRLHKLLGARMEEPAAVVEAASLAAIMAVDVPVTVAKHRERFCAAMDDDINTGAAMAELFSMADAAKDDAVSALVLRDLGRCLGLFQPGDARSTTASVSSSGVANASGGANSERLATVMALMLELRQQARANRDFATSDRIRDGLIAAGIRIKDAKNGATWELM